MSTIHIVFGPQGAGKSTYSKQLSQEKKTLLIWSFRTLLALILYYSFWDYKLVRWSLIIFIPLNLFSVFPFFLFWETVKEKWSDLKS